MSIKSIKLISIKKVFGNLKRGVKKALTHFYLKHSRIYTLIILILGVFLGCLYDGRGDLGELVFSLDKYTVYVGGFVDQPVPESK